MRVKNLIDMEVEFEGFTFGPLAEGVIDEGNASKFEDVEGFEVLEEKKKEAKKAKKESK